jgi:hypothetical protein
LAALAALAATLLASGCAREALVPTRPPEVRLKPHEEVVLDGSGSFDPEGEELAYRWRQVGGPEVELKGADTPWPRFTPTGPGRYEFELVVAAPPEGGEGAPLEGPPVRLSVDVLPPNRPPRVEIAPVVRAEPGQWAVLDGGGAEDPDGDVLSFRWEVVGGEAKGSTLPPATLVEMDPFDGRDRRVRVRAWRAGVYRFRLTVSDAFGAEATAEAVLLVAPNDLPPVGIPRVKGGASDGEPGGAGDGGRASGHFALRLGAWPHPKGGVNEPPRAVARAEGPDADGAFVLDGAASRDPNGDALDFRWEQTAGPKVRVLRQLEAPGTPDAREIAKGLARVGLTPSAPGRYAFSLVVSDGVLESAPVEVAFVVAGEAAARPEAESSAPRVAPEGVPPLVTVTTFVTADAGGDVTVETGVEVALDGRRSRAPRNAKLVHDWRQVAGPRVTSFRLDPVEGSARPRFTPEVAGQYEFELRVSPDRVQWSPPDRVRVTVLGANRPPWIEAPRVVLARAGEVVRIAASWGDPDGDPTGVVWRRVGGGRATLTQDAGVAELAAPEGGCSLEATVRDSRGGRARAVVNVRVPGEGRAPVAVARARGDVLPGGRVLLDGSESYDLEGKPLEFRWDVAGTTLVRFDGHERAVASFLAPAAGTYEFKLVVSASGRESSPALVTVDVPEPAGDEREGIVLAPVPARITAGRTVVLDASGTMWDSARPRITWTQIAGPRVARAAGREGAALGSPLYPLESPRVVIGPAEPGLYRFRVEAAAPGFAPQEVAFEVVTANARPHASARATPRRGGRVVLDGSRSRDPEGAQLRYRWTEVAGTALGLDGRLGADPRLVLEDVLPGRHAVRLAVTDGERVARSGVVEFRVDERPVRRERGP